MSLSSFFILLVILFVLLDLALLSLFFPLCLCVTWCVLFVHFLFCLYLSSCSVVNSDFLSSLTLLVGFTFHLFLILPSLLLFLLIISNFCLSWAIFSLFCPALSQCLFFSLCFFFLLCLSVSLLFVIFPFQHSSLFSCFFSAFPLLLTFEYFSLFVSLCFPLFDFMQYSILAYFCAFVWSCVCLCDKGAS